MTKVTRTRREFLARSGAIAAAAGLASHPAFVALAQQGIPQRRIPSTGEMLPVIGLGSSKVVGEIATNGTEPVASVLRALVAHGGKLIDTWPRNAANDAGFGSVISQPEFEDKLFVTTKIDQAGKDVGLKQFRDAQRNYRREVIDLAQIFSLTDLETHWGTLKELKAEGSTRYIGVTVAQDSLHGQLEQFMLRERPDFVQLNYSITERAVEERLLPLAAERGIAVIVNRPFMNGAYFDRLEGKELPAWAREFGCESWAQFSLKYILANPHFTVVLTETSNPRHMEENVLTAAGQMPNEAQRQRMREFIATV